MTANEHAMREFLVQIARNEAADGDADSSEQPLYSVPRDPRPATQAAFHQFCFFHSVQGQGVAVPDGAALALTTGLTNLLSDMPRAADMENYAQTETDPRYFFVGSERLSRSSSRRHPRGAALQGLPAGVEVYDIVGGQRTPQRAGGAYQHPLLPLSARQGGGPRRPPRRRRARRGQGGATTPDPGAYRPQDRRSPHASHQPPHFRGRRRQQHTGRRHRHRYRRIASRVHRPHPGGVGPALRANPP
jgi:hypothetical protein